MSKSHDYKSQYLLSEDEWNVILNLTEFYSQDKPEVRNETLSEFRTSLSAQIEEIHALDQKHVQLLTFSSTIMLLIAPAVVISYLRYKLDPITICVLTIFVLIFSSVLQYAISVRPGRPTGLPGTMIPPIEELPKLNNISELDHVRSFSVAMNEFKIDRNYREYSKRVRTAQQATATLIAAPLIGLIVFAIAYIVQSGPLGASLQSIHHYKGDVSDMETGD